MTHQLRAAKKQSGLNFWILSNNTIGTSFELSIFDLDINLNEPFQRLGDLLQTIKGLTIRLDFQGSHDQLFIPGHKRAQDLEQYGSKEYRLFLHCERRFTSKDLRDLDNAISMLLDLIPLDGLQRIGIAVRNLNMDEIPGFLIDPSKAISLIGNSLDLADHYLSVIKLIEPREQISSETMDYIVRMLPCPFEIKVHIRTPDPSKVAMQFQLNVKRESEGGLFSSAKRMFSNKEALEKVELEGISYLAFEWHLILRRKSLGELKEAISGASEILTKHLGDVSSGSVSQYPALVSTQIGSDFHSGSKFDFGGILETHDVLPYFLPFNLRGAWRPLPEAHSLGVHRLNHSIDFVNLFDSSYKSYSTLIVGQTGFGKSVFLSQLIRSLHFDEKTKIIVIDVKASNRRVVESLGGELLNINLQEPSGFNPFASLKYDSSEETLNILKEFVASLCLEETESVLPERLSAVIGIAIKSYGKSFKKADLKEFIGFLPKDFERHPHLRRFTEGIEAKVFEGKKDQRVHSIKKLTYYYLERIETASNRALRKALVNAVLMEFYLLLRMKAPDEKVVFICDEAPFFTQDAFSIFSMLIKTMRSLKGSLVLAVQYSSDLVVSRNNSIDESLINQAATKVLFTTDGDKDLFKSRFQLSETDYVQIQSNQSVRGQYSQFLVKDVNGSRLSRLYLTDTEFWESATDGVELIEILNLKSVFPELNDREVALILDQARARDKLYKKAFSENPVVEVNSELE